MYQFTKEQTDIRKAAKEFAEGEFAKIAVQANAAEDYPGELLRLAAQYGFIGVFLGEQYNGAGLGIFENALLYQEFWRVDPGCAGILLSTLGAEVLQRFGNDHQQKKYLHQLADGVSTCGLPADSEGLDFGFTYKRDTLGRFFLSGSSGFVINGSTADYLIIPAREAGDEGIAGDLTTLFILPNDKSVVNTRALKNKLGIRATDISSLELDQYRIDGANIIRGEGEGRPLVTYIFDLLNIYSGAMAIGLAKGCMERAVNYAKNRVQFGHPIGFFQQIKFKIAEMAGRLSSVSLMFYRAVEEFEKTANNSRDIAMANYLAKQTALLATGETLQIHGGYGYMKEMEIEKYYRDAQALELIGRSTEDSKIYIAEQYLGGL